MKLLAYSLLIIIVISCSPERYRAGEVSHKPPVDTKSKDIVYQQKRTYTFNNGSVSFDNQFDGARLNNCSQLNDSTFTVRISPENYPINSSPWYSFRIVTEEEQTIYINIEYEKARHRYRPKYSSDCKEWILVSDDNVSIYPDTTGLTISHYLESDTTWVSAQELENSDMAYEYWNARMSDHNYEFISIGESPMGSDIMMMDIYSGEKKKKPVIAIIGRQHPPEITGFYAMRAFVNRIMADDELAGNFREKYRVIVFPMVNPDGVDLGHWRHNTGGIDLNRDWGVYNQPEVRMVADRIVFESKSNRSDLVLGIDFHSTQRDIYYTQDVDPSTMLLGDFKDKWLDGITEIIPGEDLNERPSGVYPGLTSKNWFYNQFKAVGIIYEVGDRTPRDFIKRKGEVAAEVMMKILTE